MKNLLVWIWEQKKQIKEKHEAIGRTIFLKNLKDCQLCAILRKSNEYFKEDLNDWLFTYCFYKATKLKNKNIKNSRMK